MTTGVVIEDLNTHTVFAMSVAWHFDDTGKLRRESPRMRSDILKVQA